MLPPVLQVEHLSITSPAGPIFRDLSFEIYPGEIVALTGVSGSGKTSMANFILNMLPPGLHIGGGVIKVNFKDGSSYQLPGAENSWRDFRGRRIGFMQQDVYGAFDPVLRMGKQLRMIIAERSGVHKDNIDRALQSAMEVLGITEADRLLNSYPHQLSGGQLQRCMLSMMTVIMPELLIVDEPTSAVDKIHQQEVLGALQLAKEKYDIAILCITHDREVVKQLADREVPLSPTYGYLENNTRQEIIDPDNSPLLEVHKVDYAHSFGGLFSSRGARIQNIDLAVRPAECTGIIGESGSGKSTLAHLLVGLLVPDKGGVILNGRRVDYNRPADIQQLRKHIQLVMQDGRGSLHPDKTIRYLLNEVAGQNKKLSLGEIESILARALAEVNLPDTVLNRYPSQLSGGECFRVSLARALLKDPDVLICDESTSALDEQNTNEILALLNRLKSDRSMSLILIAHDIGVVLRMADEIVVMSNGVIVESGKTREIITGANHPVTRKMLSQVITQ